MTQHNKNNCEIENIKEDIKHIALKYGYTPNMLLCYGELWINSFCRNNRIFYKINNQRLKTELLNKYPFICGLK